MPMSIMTMHAQKNCFKTGKTQKNKSNWFKTENNQQGSSKVANQSINSYKLAVIGGGLHYERFRDCLSHEILNIVQL